jgi:hypothetical protein
MIFEVQNGVSLTIVNNQKLFAVVQTLPGGKEIVHYGHGMNLPSIFDAFKETIRFVMTAVTRRRTTISLKKYKIVNR